MPDSKRYIVKSKKKSSVIKILPIIRHNSKPNGKFFKYINLTTFNLEMLGIYKTIERSN